MFYNCISKFRKLNKIAKDEFLDDYDTIFRGLNTECEELFEDMMSSFASLNGGSEMKMKNAVTLENYDVHSDDFPRMGDF